MPYIGSVDQFKEHLFECAVRNGYGRYEQTILVRDGATWIRHMGEELFPDAVRILDFYHLAENSSGFGKYLFPGDEKRSTPWAEERIGLLRKSGSEEVMRRLEGYKGKVLPAGVVNPYTYIEHNKNKIDYAEFQPLPAKAGRLIVRLKAAKCCG